MSTSVPGPEPDRQPLPVPRASAPKPEGSGQTSRPLSRALERLLPFLPAAVPTAILVGIVLALVHATGFTNFGLQFFGLHWNPPVNEWGIGVFVVGSFLTAVPALVFSMLIGVGLAVASTTYLPRFVSRWLDPFVDLLAGIPSVVYGIWAFIIVAPFFGSAIEPTLVAHVSLIPGFGPPIRPDGTGLLVSVFILTLMALPITTLLIRDALRSVPHDLWESGLALGATRWEVVRRVAVPYARRGIWSAAFLGFGRAFGETVAVAMVIGSATVLPSNAYDIGNTMAAQMFETLDSAIGGTGSVHFLAALSEMALVLLTISLVVNLLGRRLIVTLYAEPVAGL
ncbi:MAG TPA: phosphate ABC transporter permease subunit PstC [Thermoplasmata archaeon]|nr:phosphate ABC transporter permease subunit PstC [Thermoplasmata archaeon]